MDFTIDLDQILELLPSSKVDGKISDPILKGIAALERAVPGDVSFLGNLKYKSLVSSTEA